MDSTKQKKAKNGYIQWTFELEMLHATPLVNRLTLSLRFEGSGMTWKVSHPVLPTFPKLPNWKSFKSGLQSKVHTFFLTVLNSVLLFKLAVSKRHEWRRSKSANHIQGCADRLPDKLQWLTALRVKPEIGTVLII